MIFESRSIHPWFIVDVNKLLDPERNRVYFSDFYCLGTKHRVTLVVTEPGSSVDNYCAKKLRPLPMIPQDPERENPFFYYDRSQGCFFFTVSVWVEVFFTQNVELNLGTLVKKTFKRRRVGYGKPKNASCIVCNISSLTRPNITPDCQQENCSICPLISTVDSVRSRTHGTIFPSAQDVTCQVANVIYLIECTYPGCGMQYVGETQHALRKRIAQHLKQDRKNEAETNQYLPEHEDIFEEKIRTRKSLPKHVNSHDEKNESPNLKITVLEKVPKLPGNDANSDLIRVMEKEWIVRLGTLSPDGINKQLWNVRAFGWFEQKFDKKSTFKTLSLIQIIRRFFL